MFFQGIIADPGRPSLTELIILALDRSRFDFSRVKFLGGGSGFDPAPNSEKGRK